MNNLTAEKESAILAALAAKVTAAAGVFRVIADEPLINSKGEFIEKLMVENVDGKLETKFIKIDLIGFRDSTEYGCDEAPTVYLKYRLHILQSYREIRSDDSASRTDLKTLILNLRNAFLETENNARKILPGCETSPLVLTRDILLDVDELTGVFGHIADLTCEVEVV